MRDDLKPNGITLADLVAAKASEYGISPQLLAAVIMQESGGRPYAMRYEPGFYSKYISGKKLSNFVPTGVSDATERFLRSCSFGLLQVMGQVARERGFKAVDLAELLIPETNLDVGAAILSSLLERYGDSLQALYHYNAGTGSEYPGDGENTYGQQVLARIDNGDIRVLA